MKSLRRTAPLAQAIYARLKADVMTGRLPPGEALQEEDLARLLGASRTPIREALRMLQNDGLVTIAHNRGAVVTDVSFRQIMEAYELREVLEPYAARLGAAKAAIEDIERLETQQRSLPGGPGSLEDMLAVDRADEELHEFIAQACGNALLQQVIRRARLLTRRLLTIVPPQRYRIGIGEHQTILAAYRRHDPDGAERAMRTHVQNAKQRLLGHESSAAKTVRKRERRAI